MHRILTSRIEEDRVALTPEDFHHLVRVLRLREGDEFEAVTGDGHRFLCRLERAGTAWWGRIQRAAYDPRESPFRIHLAPALIKWERFEWILQKGVELGVASFHPVLSERTSSTRHGGYCPRKLERWHRILQEALKQCGRGCLPRLEEPTPLAAVLERLAKHPIVFLDENTHRPLQQRVEELVGCQECLLLVGPEGGWDERERTLVRMKGVPPVGLGPRILRAETAAVAASTILQYSLGDLGRGISTPETPGESEREKPIED